MCLHPKSESRTVQRSMPIKCLGKMTIAVGMPIWTDMFWVDSSNWRGSVGIWQSHMARPCLPSYYWTLANLLFGSFIVHCVLRLLLLPYLKSAVWTLDLNLSGKVGSWLPMPTLQCRILTSQYWCPLPSKLPILMKPVQCMESMLHSNFNRSFIMLNLWHKDTLRNTIKSINHKSNNQGQYHPR